MVFLRLSFLCMCTFVLINGGVIQNNDTPELVFESDPLASDLDTWVPHLLDVLELLDVPRILAVAIKYMDDPEVIKLALFVTSPQFSEMVYEFESMEEFKEAMNFLSSKGYDMKMLMDFINSALNLPQYEKAVVLRANKTGISGLLQDIIATLPMDELKKLFQNKLETSPEISELIETLKSEEFHHILMKMSQNPKLKEFKKTLESYGFDFKIICAGAKEIFGKDYQGVFCK